MCRSFRKITSSGALPHVRRSECKLCCCCCGSRLTPGSCLLPPRVRGAGGWGGGGVQDREEKSPEAHSRLMWCHAEEWRFVPTRWEKVASLNDLSAIISTSLGYKRAPWSPHAFICSPPFVMSTHMCSQGSAYCLQNLGLSLECWLHNVVKVKNITLYIKSNFFLSVNQTLIFKCVPLTLKSCWSKLYVKCHK